VASSTAPGHHRSALGQHLRDAPAYQELGWNGEVVTTTSRRRGNRTATLLAQLAAAAAELLASQAIRLVRHCTGRDCRMLFLPASPRRRWCSPTVCGNRTRAARYYYEPHKD
jgi:predicted RNA-binding Zn ribbon-like protein